MKNQVIDLDESEVREVWPIPVIDIGCWTFTMETCLLTGELEKTVRSVFTTFPEVIQHALTFTPESGGWVDRAKLWQTALKLALSPKQYHAALRKILAHYTKVVRRRQRELCQYDLPSEQDFMREVDQFLCECYRKGVAGEPNPFADDIKAESRALSVQTGIALDEAEHLMDSSGVKLIYRLGRGTYEQGAKLRSTLQERRLPR